MVNARSTNSSLPVCPMITWNSFLSEHGQESEMCNRTFYLSEEREIIRDASFSSHNNFCMYLLKVER